MKKILKSMWAVAVAAMAFTSCSEDNALDVNPEVEKVTINITAGSEADDAETRTHLDGTAQVKWDAQGEALQVIEYTTKMADAATTEAVVSEDGLTAKFKVQLPANTTASTYDYCAIYPAANFVDKNNGSLTEFKMELPTEQTTVAGSFDPKADLLVSKKVTTTTQATDLDFQFHRPITVVQLQLMGITEGEKISSVVFENTTAALSGRLYYNWDTNTVTEYGYQGQGFKTINMTCNQVATGTDDIYFTSFPADLTDFTVTVSTDKATYTKTVENIPAGKLSFKAGHKANVRVKGMTREEKVLDTYTLLTTENISKLVEGYRLIITNGNTGSVKAMGAKEADKNRMGLSSAITVKSVPNATVINTIPTDVQVLSLEGDATNGFLLSSEYGYLSLNGTANELKHVKDAADASKWKISVAKAGNIDIICGTRPIRFNNTFFASYKGTGSCSPVYAFFKEGVAKTPLANPANLKATVAQGTNTVNVSWDAVANAATYTVTVDYGTGNPVKQEVETNSAIIENLTWNTTATVYVVANPKAGDETYKSSAAVSTKITIGVNPNAGNGTIKELRALMQDENYDVKTYCGGVVDAYVAAVYSGKVAVVDNTGEVGSGLMLYQAKGSVNVGQKITIDLTSATRNIFNGLLQIKGATVTVKDATPIEIVKPIITATQFNTGDYQGLYVRINATTPATAGTWGDYPTMTGADNTTFNTRASDQALKAISFSANKKGIIGGIADCYKAQQIVPQTEEDVKDFMDATPSISFGSTSLSVESSVTSAKFAFTRNSFATSSNVTANTDAAWVTSVKVVGNEVQCGFAANNTGADRTASIKVNLDGKLAQTLTLTQKKVGSSQTLQSITFDVNAYAKANKWTSGTAYNDAIDLGNGYSVQVPKAGNNSGKYYSSKGGNWRIYSTESGKLLVKGNGIVKVEITYSEGALSTTWGNNTATTNPHTWEGTATNAITFTADAKTFVNKIVIYHE